MPDQILYSELYDIVVLERRGKIVSTIEWDIQDMEYIRGLHPDSRDVDPYFLVHIWERICEY